MLVWCMLVVGLNDEMKNQHAQVKKLDLCSFYGNQILASNVDLMRYSSFCVCLVTHGAKDGILVHSDWYHASKVHLLYLSIIWQKLSPIFPIQAYVQSFNPNSQHIYRGSNCYHMEFMKLIYIPLHIVNMLGQATWIQNDFNLYLCERVVINYKKGEIESSSLILVN